MISIHALLAESDCPCWPPWQRACVFLSTLSLRRATGRAGRPPARLPDFYPRSPCGERHRRRCCCNPTTGYFYPRSPCGERPQQTCYERDCPRISIHALLAESDIARDIVLPYILLFLSTLSLRRATLHCNTPITLRHYFYPRSPCGERLFGCWTAPSLLLRFLSTLSLRRATL